jgi:hypothetical protein
MVRKPSKPLNPLRTFLHDESGPQEDIVEYHVDSGNHKGETIRPDIRLWVSRGLCFLTRRAKTQPSECLPILTAGLDTT